MNYKTRLMILKVKINRLNQANSKIQTALAKHKRHYNKKIMKLRSLTIKL